jgi:hypothetical protein
VVILFDERFIVMRVMLGLGKVRDLRRRWTSLALSRSDQGHSIPKSRHGSPAIVRESLRCPSSQSETARSSASLKSAMAEIR